MTKATAIGLIGRYASDSLEVEIKVPGSNSTVKVPATGRVAGDACYLTIPAQSLLLMKGKPWDGQNPRPEAMVDTLAPDINAARAKLQEALKGLPAEMAADILRSHGFTQGGVSSGSRTTQRGQSGRAAAKPNAEKFPVGTKVKQTATGDTWTIAGHSASHYQLKNGSNTRDIQRFNKQWVPQK